MHIVYVFECIAHHTVLHRVLCLIIQHIVDVGVSQRASCYVIRGVCYILSGEKFVSTIEIRRVGFDLIRIKIDQHVA